MAAVPFKPNALQAFGRLLNAPFRILRDLVQIVKLELVAAFAQQHPGLKWSVQLCLTVPPSAPAFVPVGSAAFLTARNKMLFFLHLRRLGMPADADGASVVLPLVYDVSTNVTQVNNQLASSKLKKPYLQRTYEVLLNNVSNSCSIQLVFSSSLFLF